MKKALFVFLLLPLIASSQATKIINFDAGSWGPAQTPCDPPPGTSYSICDIGQGYRTVSGVKVRTTHGCPIAGSSGQLSLTTFFSNTDGHPLGDGVAFEFQFKKGFKYIFTIRGAVQNNELQMRMTNNPVYSSRVCNIDHPPVDISQPANASVFASITYSSFNHDVANNTAVVELTPDDCYNYLWFSSRPLVGTGDELCFFKSIMIQEINPFSISGNSTSCSSTSPYGVNYFDTPYIGAVSWQSLNPNIATINSAGVVTKVTNGLATIVATIAGCNGNTIITKQVYVGTIDQSKLFLYHDFNVCAGRDVSFGAFYSSDGEVIDNCSLRDAGATNVEWEIFPSSYQINYNAGSGGCFLSTIRSAVTINFSSQVSNASVSFRVQNACGWSSWIDPMPIQVKQCGFRFAVSPNPSQGIVNISQAKDDGITARQAKDDMTFTSVRVYDNAGNLKKQWKLGKGTKQTQINVSELQTGVYILEIANETTMERQQLLIGK